jgi:5-methylcytosine-specific restriction endonuclease McrA
MPWVNGAPGSHIPERAKRTVRNRDQVCQLQYPNICTGTIDEFDHIIGVKESHTDRPSTSTPEHLRGVCIPCHKKRTQQQATASRNRWKRQPEQHPGLKL